MHANEFRLPEQLIREHLATLLASTQFAKSERLKRFLEFVVDCKLRGREDGIQEYTIGLEVFDRGESFDPRSDSIVRVEAHRLRARLADYYANEGRKSPIRILLPGPGYIPSFETPERAGNPAFRRVAFLVALLLVLLAGILWNLPWTTSKHRHPALAREALDKGLVAWQQWTANGAREAEKLFQQAISHDPDYALAYAWLSTAYRQQAIMGDRDPREAFADSSRAARKAVSIDPQLAEAQSSLAANLTFAPDWKAAEQTFLKALGLEPDNPDTHHAFGILLLAVSPARLGEAEAELRQALRLQPGNLNHSVVLAKILYFRGRFREARSLLEEILSIDNYHPDAMRNLGAALLRMGDLERAVHYFEEAQELAPLRWGEGLLGYALAVSGEEERARTILANLESGFDEKPVAALAIGTLYVGLRDWDRACVWLDQAWAQREVRTRYLAVDPMYASMQGQARFIELVESMGLSKLTSKH